MFDWLKRARQNEHDLAQESLSAFLDGELQTGEHARVEKHLQECGTCRADLEALRQTVALVRAAPALKPPRAFVLPASETVKQGQVRRMRLSYGYLQAATAMATALLILVVSADALLRYAPPRQASPLPSTAAESMAVTQEPSLADAATAISSELSSGGIEAGKVAAVPAQSPAVDTPLVAPSEAPPDMQAAQARPSQTFARSAGPPAAAPGATAESFAGQITSLVEPTLQPEPTLVALGVAAPEATEVAEKAIPPLAAAPSAQVEAPSAQPSVVVEPISNTVAAREVEPTATVESEAVSSGTAVSPTAYGTVVSEVPTVAPVAVAPATPPPATVVLPTATAVPPTAAPMPMQTPVLPTATPMPAQSVIAYGALPTRQPEVVAPLVQQPAGPTEPASFTAWLEARRPWLPWIELTLGLLAVAFLLGTFWLRHRVRSV